MIWVISLKTERATAELLAELLPALDYSFNEWIDENSGHSTVSLFFDSEQEALAQLPTIKAAMQSWAELLPEPVQCLPPQEMQEEDWSETWKQYFHTERISERLIIKPSWETYDALPDDLVIHIDPGMSFGTGLHGTTRGCLKFLDAVSRPGASVVDAGCGSGILSIAAVKLGYRPVYAFDLDPVAVTTSAENFVINGITDQVILSQSDLTAFKTPCEIVIANILAEVLCANREHLLSLLAPGPGSRLILSGILNTQYEEVHTQFVGSGLYEEGRITIDEWTSGCFAKVP